MSTDRSGEIARLKVNLMLLSQISSLLTADLQIRPHSEATSAWTGCCAQASGYHSHPMPSLSRSNLGAYPGSPRRTGAAPAARASVQLANGRVLALARAGAEKLCRGTAELWEPEAPPRWQWYSPVFRLLWQPSAFRPPGCANANVGASKVISVAKTIAALMLCLILENFWSANLLPPTHLFKAVSALTNF